MRSCRSSLSHAFLTFAFLAVLAGARDATAFDRFWVGTTGPWTTGTNWDGIEGVPNATFEDVGIINNGGTATLNTTAIDAAGLALGYDVGASGTVIIQNGGSLTLIETPGAAGTAPPNGSANVGFEGGTGGEGDSGLLEIQGGGSLTAVLFDINQHGTFRIGTGTGAATATTSSGSLFSNGTVEVIGPGHTFSLAGNATFEEKAEGDSRFVPHITGLNHTVMNVTGTAFLGGSLVPVFDGHTPQVGESWNLIDAAAVEGAFDIDATGAPTPAAGTAYTTRVVSGGNGEILQFGLEAFATLTVNTDTGAMSIASESGAPINMVGYSVLSPGGQLNPANWNSLTNQSTPGWEEAGGTANALSELNPQGSLTLNTTPNNLGSGVFVPPTEFGVSPDITFEYGVDGDLEATQGIVKLTGLSAVNDLLLTVDPTTGEGQLKNSSPFTIDLLGYSILSTSGSLDDANWTSLESQAVSGWDEVASDEFSLNELVPEDPAATLNPGEAFSLGDMFLVGGTRDLQLEFILSATGGPEIRQGMVQYGEIQEVVAVEGDYNGDGVVNAADYVVFRDKLGGTGLLNEGTGISPGVVDGNDYAFWKSRFGATSGAGAGAWAAASAPVPEPSTLVSAVVAMLALLSVCVRKPVLSRCPGAKAEKAALFFDWS